MFDRPILRMSNRPAVLMRNVSLKVLDVSGSGCLVESTRRVDVGTVGRLRLKLGSEDYDDDVEVVRCDAVPGTRPVYHLGIRFLWTSPPQEGSIRDAVTNQPVEVNLPEQIWVM